MKKRYKVDLVMGVALLWAFVVIAFMWAIIVGCIE